MKKLAISVLFAALLMPALVNAQQKNATIAFSKLVNDFGTIKEDDGLVRCDFEFTNTGATPLIIHRVITTCGCTTPSWTKEPVAPGEKGIVSVQYDPKKRPGKIDQTITVYNNTETPALVLQIKGFVKEHEKTLEEIYSRSIGDLRFESNQIRLSRIYAGKSVTDTLRYMNFGSDPVTVTANLSSFPHLTVKFIPETVKPQEAGLMVVTFDTQKRNDWGLVNDRIILNLNGKLIQTNFITISGTIEEDFSNLSQEQLDNAPKIEFENTTYDFSEVNEGNKVEHEFTFKNTGKSDLIIRKIKPSCGCTTVEPSEKLLKPGESSSIKATVKTNGYSGRQSKSITVITNDPKNSTTVLRITGTVVKASE